MNVASNEWLIKNRKDHILAINYICQHVVLCRLLATNDHHVNDK